MSNTKPARPYPEGYTMEERVVDLEKSMDYVGDWCRALQDRIQHLETALQIARKENQ